MSSNQRNWSCIIESTRNKYVRQLRRCNGSHCLTITNVPIDVYVTMGRPSNLQCGQAS
eukprot:gi/632963417/ref/XP_007897868.1/ PREDICTED: protein FAM229B [Callorhinchus milii]